MTKQAIIYTRFSPRPNARECDSCERQEERCRWYCHQRDYHVDHAFHDENVSGGILDRPRLGAAIESLQPGMILVVDSSDRLARDMHVYYAIVGEVQAAGATIEYANGQPCADTPEGRYIQGIFALNAAYERDRVRHNTKRGLSRKRKNGERVSRHAPIGWMKDPKDSKRLVVCKREREAIIEICRLSGMCFLPGQIARILTDSYGLFRGKPWSTRNVRTVIQRHAHWADPVSGDSALEPTHP